MTLHDKLSRISGVDWQIAAISETAQRWREVEQQILAEANRRHDAQLG